MDDYNDRLAFLAYWSDTQVSFTKNLLFLYYPCDNTIQLYDKDLNRIFMKRSKYDGISARDIFIGNTVTIYGRQIHIIEYADERTRSFMGKARERAFTFIKPGANEKLGQIIALFEERQFQINRMRMCKLSRREALEFYEPQRGNPFLPFTLENVVSGSIVAIELVANNAIERLTEELGPVDPIIARETHPKTFRALFGHERSSNGFHGAKDTTEVIRDTNYFFPPKNSSRKPPETTLQLQNSTCCIIKPHAIQEGKLGCILKEINESLFYITAMQMFHLSHADADEFLEVYKGVVSDYNSLLLSFLNGPCVALEISARNPEIHVYEEFRNFAGPSDPDIAKQIRPNTLRAKFGVDKYRNAVHCTDLLEDTTLELEYFFKIIN